MSRTVATTGKAGNAERFKLFVRHYRNGGPQFGPGNALQSAVAAGYSEATARANCHLLAARARILIASALRVLGGDEFLIAKKLIQLTEIKAVKWNPADEEFEAFEDGPTQLAAAREIGKLLDAYPAPKEQTGDQRPVQIIFPANFGNLAVKVEAGD